MPEDAPALPAPEASALAPLPPLSPIEILPVSEDSDARLVALWLHSEAKAQGDELGHV